MRPDTQPGLVPPIPGRDLFGGRGALQRAIECIWGDDRNERPDPYLTPWHKVQFRDEAAEHFARHTGSHWHPRSGSLVNHRALTSAVIDSRDFLAAKRVLITDRPPAASAACLPWSVRLH
jgi:hypothetical protein